MENFIDEIRNNPNRMNIKILSQSANNIVADITPAYIVVTAGTPITAEKMNEIKNLVESSANNAITANSISTQASLTATSANEKAEEALQKSEQAISTASGANTKSDQTRSYVDGEMTRLSQLLTEKQGSIAYENGQKIDSFELTDKANQSDLETLQNLLQNQISSLQTAMANLQTELTNLKNGTSTFTLLKAKTIDLVD